VSVAGNGIEYLMNLVKLKGPEENVVNYRKM
jgi:hypothetical protein